MKPNTYSALLGFSLMLAAGTASAAALTGAGATFPQPLYTQWAQSYQTATQNQVNYQGIGSSGGVKQIVAGTVDFGATDDPLSKAEQDKQGLVQFPAVVGGVVPIVNIEGVAPGRLRLTGAVLADIYLGKINQWNDAAITKLNPGVKLPASQIIRVVRADGSGTTFNFTHYLNQVSGAWRSVGASKSPKWPVQEAAGKGNAGVAQYVGRLKNSIGYVEYAFAKQNKLAHTQLQNKAGKFVQPSQATFAAAAQVNWQSAPGYNLVLTNQAGANAWPITAATFILLPVNGKPGQNAEVIKFFDWAFKNGNNAAKKLDYVPLPAATKTQVRNTWKNMK